MKNKYKQLLLILSIIFIPTSALAYSTLQVHVNNQFGQDVDVEINGLVKSKASSQPELHFYELPDSKFWNYSGICSGTVYNT